MYVKIKVCFVGAFLLLSACAGLKEHEFKRIVSSETKSILLTQTPLKVGVLWAQSVQYKMGIACDSCYGASANHFEFEFSNSQEKKWELFKPAWQFARVVPGMGSVELDDSLMDTVQRRLSNWGVFLQEDLKANPQHQILQDLELEDDIVDLLKQFRTKYQLDYVIIPLETRVEIFPNGGEPKSGGQYRAEQLWTWWRLDEVKLLYASYSRVLVHKNRPDDVDRDNTKYLLNPIIEDLQKLQGLEQ